MRILLIRHGKDDGRYRGGWSEMPLTEEGVEQVKKLSEYLYENREKFQIERIISSDLKRARQTAEKINSRLNLPVEFTSKLREMNNGDIAGMLNEDVERLYPGLYYNTLDIDERYPGGESPNEFYNRIVRDFEKIISDNVKNQNLALITHSGVINIIYKYVNNQPWSNKIKSIKIANAGFYSLVIDGGKRYFELENVHDYLE